MFIPDKIETGKELRKLREKSGLSRDDVADELDITPQAVGKYERGEALPCLPHAKGLACLYGVSIDAFLRGENVKKERKLYPC